MTAYRFVLALTVLALVFPAGCAQQRATESPENTIESALGQAQLNAVNVAENRETRTITNEIGVRQMGEAGAAEQRDESAEDKATREKIMAEINAAPDLDEVDIRM